MTDLYLLIGGNQGDRLHLIQQATDLIRQRIGSVAAFSHLYETAPWGTFAPDERPQNFLNQALLVPTSLTPQQALAEALDIEKALGRRRPVSLIENGELGMENWDGKKEPEALSHLAETRRATSLHRTQITDHRSQITDYRSQKTYTSRPIDIDLIFYGQTILDTPSLTLPHPRMHLRRFVLQPLCDIAPNFIHPIYKVTLLQLLNSCPDTSSCSCL